MKRIIFCFILIFCAGLVFSQTDRNVRYVAVQSTPIKSSTGFFSNDVGTLSFGDTVALISDNGRWSRIRSGNITGWVASSALSARRVVAGNTTVGLSASEVALAGKGFSPEMEIDFRRNGLEYSGVDAMESISILPNDLLRFINDGRLARGDQSQAGLNFFAPVEDDFTLADSYYLGRTVAANILASYRASQNAEAIQYINRICQTLVINSLTPEIYKGYFVMILDTDEFNAFATPGGHIFITRGLIQAVNSEDMLAAVIAHELAHIMLRHSIVIINETQIERELTAIAGRASAIAATQSAEAARAATFRNSIASTVDVLMTNGYSHTQEYEADLEAIVLLTRAGYDPSAYIEMLRVLQQAQRSQMSGLYSTHPAPAMRINNVQALQFRANNSRQHRVQRFRGVSW